MPLTPGNSRATISNNISEFHTGKTYAHTASKFGKDRANKQAIAVALSEARRSGRADGGLVDDTVTSLTGRDRGQRALYNATHDPLLGTKPASPQYLDTSMKADAAEARGISNVVPRRQSNDGRADGGVAPSPFDMTPAQRIAMGFNDVGGNQGVNDTASVTPNSMTLAQGGDMLSAMLARKQNPSTADVDMIAPVGYDTGGAVDPVTAVINALNVGAGSSSNNSASGIGQAAPTTSPTPTTGAANVQPTTTTSAAAPGVVSPPPSPPATATVQQQAQPGVTPLPTQTAPSSLQPAPPPAPAGSIGGPPVQLGVASTPPSSPQPTGVSAIQQQMTAAGPSGMLAKGGVAHRSGGGFNMAQGPMLNAPWEEKQEARALHVGPVLSNVPGRTDNHAVKVPAGSYVLPAQHIASLGHGNSNAGLSIASRMFSGPYGTSAMRIGGGHGNMPKPPKPMTTFADGGTSDGGSRGSGHFEPVPVDISGGEYVISPEAIIHRFGNLKKGHAALDQWVMETRKREIATQKRLPPPAKE